MVNKASCVSATSDRVRSILHRLQPWLLKQQHSHYRFTSQR